MQIFFLYHGRLRPHHNQEGMKECNSSAFLRSNRAIQLTYRNPPHIPALTECNPQLLQTYRPKGWPSTDCYDKDVCITGFHQQRFTALLRCTPGMYTYFVSVYELLLLLCTLHSSCTAAAVQLLGLSLKHQISVEI